MNKPIPSGHSILCTSAPGRSCEWCWWFDGWMGITFRDGTTSLDGPGICGNPKCWPHVSIAKPESACAHWEAMPGNDPRCPAPDWD